MSQELFFEGTGSDGYNDAYRYVPSSGSDPTAGQLDEIGTATASGQGGDLATSIEDGGVSAIGFGGKILFAGGSDDSVLIVDDPATHSYTGINPADLYGNVDDAGLDPQDFVTSGNGSSVYFVANDTYGRTLWVTNGTSSGTHEVSVNGHGVTDNGQMANLGSNLFFNGNANGGTSRDLVEYNGSTASTVKGGTGLNPIDMISVGVGVAGSSTFVTDLFFNGDGSAGVNGSYNAGTGDLYVSNGSSVQDIGKGLHPTDLTALTFTNSQGKQQTDVVFNGTDSHGHENLYMVTAGSGPGGMTTPVEILGGSGVASGGLNPNDITACNGKLYFAGNESGTYTGTIADGDANPQGLWVYDPNKGGTASLVDAVHSGTGASVQIGGNNYDLNTSINNSQATINPQSQMAAIGNDLYFTANCGNTQGGIFTYDTSTNTVFNHLGGTAGTNGYSLTAVNV